MRVEGRALRVWPEGRDGVSTIEVMPTTTRDAACWMPTHAESAPRGTTELLERKLKPELGDRDRDETPKEDI